MSELDREFANPPAAYRGKPFWAWNGKLDAAELRRQIRVMHRMGLGGFFMHSRVGLATDYLSEEWFDMIRACVDQAKKLEMEAWLYDEDRWPSGAAGGLVTKDERYRRRSLVMLVGEPGEIRTDSEPVAVFSAEVEGRSLREPERLEDLEETESLPEGRQVVAFFVKLDECTPWHNDYTYLDTLSHEAVRRFIDVTHEAYRREVGEDFEEVIPGIFTDEPNYGHVISDVTFEGVECHGVPWTGTLPETFRERYGYDLLEHLPEIFLDLDDEPVSRVRRHYMDCITHLFTDAFARQIGDWCEENGLKHTGHVLAEASLASQTSVVGTAMRFYEHMQAQGIDILTEHNDEYGTAKQCSSVQHQLGRRWVLSETYGCTGWDFSFEGHKAIGDWQAALGINLRCQHLSWYTMAGQAKRDYPASIHYQSPWWEFYSRVEDYFARVNVLTSRGEAVRPLLVIHPIESVWSLAGLEWREHEAVGRLDRQHEELRRWLLQEHVDFDYGDEDMLDRWGEVVRNHNGPALRLYQARYEAVLVPPLVTMRNSTREMLQQFVEAGGRVIFCGGLPAYVDATPAEDGSFDFADDCTQVGWDRDEVTAAASDAGRVVSITDEDGQEHPSVLYLLHRHDGRLSLFMCNTDREQATGPLTVEVCGEGPVELWDAESGERYSAASEQERGSVRFATEMPPTGSRLFVMGGEETDLPRRPALSVRDSSELPEGGWTAQLSQPNVLVLDRVCFRVDGGDWRGPEEVLKADMAIRDEVGLPHRGGQMVQPWARDKEQAGPSGAVEILSEFEVECLPTGELKLALEDPHRYEITLNGEPISTDAECGWWVDRSIRVLPVDPAVLVEGTNRLRLRGRYDDDAGLETMFLLGDFSVRLDGAEATLDAPRRPEFGDWTQQGLPFYSGAVTFRRTVEVEAQKGDRVFVEIPSFRGTCVRVLVEGQEAGIVAWEPQEVEITGLLEGRQSVELALEVVSHRRNAFGPLHNTETWPRWTGPAQFVTTGEGWQEEYNLVPCGCMELPLISYRANV